ncbi:transmembrane anchor protein [Bosea sp. (in: a-proteobacteria)]|uniref:transmembrane anchor protein n=1 Tax=Bosea sp. (in: a-proteobacteria) TaxID=1871050 RepID=UPI001AC1CD4F|nr:transmembrane anchor protein [Bosea sp. (in: a-proteobacteria)]MBN9435807.1 transmembrane anchor protein [Bosea sp. (in: a-proteobacteria)]
MYNTDLPTRAELPSSAQLLRSTGIAFISAVFILVTIVLPAEYAIDPTGIGRTLRLTEMGEIKGQLAAEAAKDRESSTAPAQAVPAQPSPDKRSSVFDQFFANLVISSASAQQPIVLAQATKPRSDETVITLKPTEGVEYKLTVKAGAKVNFSWVATGGVVNYDLHGTAPEGGKEKSFKQGRGVAKDEGVIAAEVDGVQGWFFRNRGSSEITIILKTNGAYGEIKRMV